MTCDTTWLKFVATAKFGLGTQLLISVIRQCKHARAETIHHHSLQHGRLCGSFLTSEDFFDQ